MHTHTNRFPVQLISLYVLLHAFGCDSFDRDVADQLLRAELFAPDARDSRTRVTIEVLSSALSHTEFEVTAMGLRRTGGYQNYLPGNAQSRTYGFSTGGFMDSRPCIAAMAESGLISSVETAVLPNEWSVLDVGRTGSGTPVPVDTETLELARVWGSWDRFTSRDPRGTRGFIIQIAEEAFVPEEWERWAENARRRPQAMVHNIVVQVPTKTFVGVTGITDGSDATTKLVEFTYRHGLDGIAPLVSAMYGNGAMRRRCLSAAPSPGEYTGRAAFRRFDDGWRLEGVTW